MSERFIKQLSINEQAERAATQLIEHLSEKKVDEGVATAAILYFEGLSDPCERIEYVSSLIKPIDNQSNLSGNETPTVDEKKKRRHNNWALLGGKKEKNAHNARRRISKERFERAKGG